MGTSPFSVATWGLVNPVTNNAQPYAPPYQPPAFNPLFNMQALQDSLNNIPTDMTGINAYRSQALRSGPSTWASLQKTSNAAQLANQKEKAVQSGAAQTAGADAQLASNGGLSSGARERVAEGGAKNAMDVSQNLQREANINDLQTGINDETNRIQQLGALPGLENQATQPLFQKAQILTNANAQENEAANQYNQSLYQTNMAGYGANQSANATASAGNQGFLGTGLKIGSFICAELTERRLMSYDNRVFLHKLMRSRMRNRREFFLWYFKNAPKAILIANQEGHDWSETLPWVLAVIDLFKTNRPLAAEQLYARNAARFAEKYLGMSNNFVNYVSPPEETEVRA